MPNQFGPTYAAGNAASSHNAMRHGLTIPFDTFRHPAPNRINALRNEIPPHPPETTHPGPTSPFDTFRHPRPIESTPCETKVRSHRAVTQRVQVPLQEFSVCLDS